MEITPMMPEGTIMRQMETRTGSAIVKAPAAPAEISTEATSSPSIIETAPVSDSTSLSPQQEVEQKSTKVSEKEVQESSRLRAMILKEKQLLKRARELDARQKAIEQTQSTYKPWQEAAEIAKTDKLEAMRRLGISYDDATKQLLNNGNVPPEIVAEQRAMAAAEERIQQFEKRMLQQQEQQQKQQYSNAIRQIDAEVHELVNNTDKFPLVKEAEAYHDVTRLIESEFHRTGKILPVEDAINRWENEIADGLAVLARHEKVRTRLQPQEPVKEEPKPSLEPISKVSTLTHKTTQATPAPRPLTEAERRQRAIDAFYGRLTN